MKVVFRTTGLAGALAVVAASAATPASQEDGSAGARVEQRSSSQRAFADADLHPRLRLYPSVELRGRAATIRVTHVNVPSLEVKVVGGTSTLGTPLPWTRLHFAHGAWRGVLPVPVLRGIYPLELRVREGGRVMGSGDWLLRVFALGTQSRPSFSTPEGVAGWWVRTVPFEGLLVATKRWPLSAGDLRDPRRHKKVVIAYTVAGHHAVEDRVGVFVTAVRAGVHGRWRLLEATVSP